MADSYGLAFLGTDGKVPASALPEGTQGPPGATGATGPQGIQGIQGPTGATGATGQTGATGSTGPQGTAGTNGTNGSPLSVASAWPLGSVFLSVVSTNPATLLGIGTWSQIAGGKMLIGQGNAPFDVAENTGGSSTTTPAGSVAAPVFTGTASQVTSATSAGTPAGTNSTSTVATATGSKAGTSAGAFNTIGGVSPGSSFTVPAQTFTGSALATHTHTLTPAGTNSAPAFTGQSGSVLNPYLVVYVWKRTA